MPEEKQPAMRAVKQVTIEQAVEAENGQITLENIEIAGVNYTLKISNINGRLGLDFNDQDYVITIDDEGIKFDRTKYRTDHDHDDFEHLLIGIDDSVVGVKKGELIWFSRFPYPKEGRDFYRVPFGAVGNK